MLSIQQPDEMCNILDRFYNRENEITSIAQSIEDNELYPERIINFFGVAGSGKSWLLKWLYCFYYQKLPTFILDSNSPLRLPATKEGLLQEKVFEFFKKNTPDRNHFENNDTTSDIDQMLTNFDIQNKHIIILIDDYDKLPNHLRNMFEVNILNEAIKHTSCICILTSKSNISFQNKPGLNLHTAYKELDPFSLEVLERKYDRYSDFASNIYNITAGLPICVERLVDQLQTGDIDSVVRFKEVEKPLVKFNYERIVKEYVLIDIPPKLHDTACILSIPRRFNVGILSDLLPIMLPDAYQGYTGVDYLELIDELGYLACWNPGRNGYTIQKTVRQIISYYMQLFDANAYSEITKRLLKLYERNIEVSHPKALDVIEYLYHKLVLLRITNISSTSFENISLQFSIEVKWWFDKFSREDISLDELNTIRQSLITDQDLNTFLTGEVKQYITTKLKESNKHS